MVLRAYAKYCKQIGFALSQAFIEATLASHPRIARMLVQLFKLRFGPQGADAAGASSQVNAIEQALEKVSSLSEDRVLRQLLRRSHDLACPTNGSRYSAPGQSVPASARP